VVIAKLRMMALRTLIALSCVLTLTLFGRFVLPPEENKLSVQSSVAEALLPDPLSRVIRATLIAAEKNQIDHNHIITVIDYSLPANQKRLWVFDLNTKQLLFHTYVSHGIKSGALMSNRFSNRNNSKASSMGIYRTQKTYYGREGLTLKLQGLDIGFNDNAENRAIVMHGGWYMEEGFITKYGRSGRSWGCPALPLSVSNDIINTIKDNALLIIYYPDKAWFSRSKFLQEDTFFATTALQMAESDQSSLDEAVREDVLFANLNSFLPHKMDEAVLVISAINYQQQFQQPPPLTRMLRRQINGEEYIAITPNELNQLVTAPEVNFSVLKFVTPTLRMERGYYLTEMKPIDLGPIKSIQHEPQYTVRYQNNISVAMHTNNKFIRWLGL